MQALVFGYLVLCSMAYNQIDVYNFGVGQADSQLIVFSNGDLTDVKNRYTIMIDFGSTFSPMQVVNQQMANILKTPSIDVGVVTHLHNDHFSVQCKALKCFMSTSSENNCGSFTQFAFGTFYETESENSLSSGCYAEAMSKFCKGTRVIARSGKYVVNQNGAKVKIIAANADKLAKNSDENTNSIALHVSLGSFKYFTAGDLTTNVEDIIGSSVGKVDLFKASHHGSDTSSSSDYINMIHPSVSVISSELKKKDCIPKMSSIEHLTAVSKVLLTGGASDNRCEEYARVNALGEPFYKNQGTVHTTYKVGDNFMTVVSQNKKLKCTLHSTGSPSCSVTSI